MNIEIIEKKIMNEKIFELILDDTFSNMSLNILDNDKVIGSVPFIKCNISCERSGCDVIFYIPIQYKEKISEIPNIFNILNESSSFMDEFKIVFPLKYLKIYEASVDNVVSTVQDAINRGDIDLK